MAGTGAAVAVGGIALVTGVCVGWWMGATKADAVAIDYGRQITEAKAQTTEVERRAKENEDRVKSQESRARGFESQLRDLQQELADARKLLDERTAALEQAKAQLAAASAGAAPAPKKKGPRFAFGQYGKLAEVDWTTVGENLNAMTPLCDSVAKKLAAGGDLPGEDIGRIQQHNGPLVAAAVKVMKELPGTGANGSFTHPAFMVNAIASTLDAAGKPLTDGEATAIEKVARDFSDEDARRLAGYPTGTYAMQKTIEEADLRRRFFDAAFAVLTRDQRETLVPPSVKGLVGFDLFSDGLLWATVMRPIGFKERDLDALVTESAGAMNAGLHIPKEQQDAARAVVAKWAKDLTVSLVTAPDEGASKYETHVETVREAAKQSLALVQSLSADLKLEGKQAEAARNWPVVLLPAPQRAE